MTDTKVLNIDADLAEYFEFEIKENVYKMRYPTVEETDELRSSATDEMRTRALLFQYITPADEKSPTIQDFYKTLPINKWNKLVRFIIGKLNE